VTALVVPDKRLMLVFFPPYILTEKKRGGGGEKGGEDSRVDRLLSHRVRHVRLQHGFYPEWLK